MIGRILLERRQSKLFIFILGVGISLCTYQFHTIQTAAIEILYKPTLKTCLMPSVSLLRWIENPLGWEPGNTECYSLGGSQSGSREPGDNTGHSTCSNFQPRSRERFPPSASTALAGEGFPSAGKLLQGGSGFRTVATLPC